MGLGSDIGGPNTLQGFQNITGDLMQNQVSGLPQGNPFAPAQPSQGGLLDVNVPDGNFLRNPNNNDIPVRQLYGGLELPSYGQLDPTQLNEFNRLQGNEYYIDPVLGPQGGVPSAISQPGGAQYQVSAEEQAELDRIARQEEWERQERLSGGE